MLPQIVDPQVQASLFDDFHSLNTAATNGLWLSTKGTGGTLALQDLANGRLNIPTAASANDYQLLSTQKKCVKFAANKPVWFEALISCTEANTNNANWVVGVSSVITTGFLQTASGGPPSTFDGFVIWKQGGGLKFQSTSSAGSTQTTNTNLTTVNVSAFVSGTDYRVGFHFDPNDGVTGLITPLINGLPQVVNANIYQHKIALSGLGVMYPIFGINAGSTSAETLQIDYIRVVQER